MHHGLREYCSSWRQIHAFLDWLGERECALNVTWMMLGKATRSNDGQGTHSRDGLCYIDILLRQGHWMGRKGI